MHFKSSVCQCNLKQLMFPWSVAEKQLLGSIQGGMNSQNEMKILHRKSLHMTEREFKVCFLQKRKLLLRNLKK